MVATQDYTKRSQIQKGIKGKGARGLFRIQSRNDGRSKGTRKKNYTVQEGWIYAKQCGAKMSENGKVFSRITCIFGARRS